MNNRHLPPNLQEFHSKHDAIDKMYKLRRNRKKNKKRGKILGYVFSVILYLLVMGLVASYLFREYRNIATAIDAKIGTNLLAMFETNGSSLSPDSASCDQVSTFIGEDDGLTHFKHIEIGFCYKVGNEYRSLWSNIIDEDAETVRFAQHIFTNSKSQALSVEEVAIRLKAVPGNNWILDLRVNTVQTQNSASSPSTSTSNSGSQVVPIPWPDKDSGYTLEELVDAMESHHILSVSGTVGDDPTKWALYYQVSEEIEDYVIFDNSGSELPKKCDTATSLTLSVIPTGNSDEKLIDVGNTDKDIIVVCK